MKQFDSEASAIVTHLSNGYNLREIRAFMPMSYGQIYRVVRELQDQYGCKNYAELVSYCLRRGLIK